MVCADIPENIRLLKEGNRLWQRGKRTSMIIRYVKLDSITRQITVHGYTALDRLNQRIIYPAMNITNVEAGMRDIVLNNIRGLQNFTAAPEQGLTETHNTQFTGHELLEALNTLGVESEIGFYAFFDYPNRCDEFRVYKGNDFTQGEKIILFKEEFGNLPNMTIVDDNTVFKNVAYVAGAGEGNERAWAIVGNSAGNDRHELYVDARDLQPDTGAGENNNSPAYIQRLTARGIESLNERVRAQSFQAQVDAPDFGSSFYIGDLVTCNSTRYGVTLKTRVISYKEVTERNAMSRYLVFGTPEITALEELRLKL